MSKPARPMGFFRYIVRGMDPGEVSMRKPAKLTLKQALEAIKKPLKRWGDLIIVQVMTGQPEGWEPKPGWGPPNGELRTTFMPNPPNLPESEGTFDPVFPLMTASWLEQWYAGGGWVESVEHFSEVELALHYEYQGGVFKPGAWAGSVGDASAFERDCEEAATHEPVLTAEVDRTIRGNILRQHKKYLIPAQTGEKFLSGRKLGTKSATTEYLTALICRFPTVSSKELYTQALADAGENHSPFTSNPSNDLIKPDGKPMGLKTFENTVSKLKKRGI